MSSKIWDTISRRNPTVLLGRLLAHFSETGKSLISGMQYAKQEQQTQNQKMTLMSELGHQSFPKEVHYTFRYNFGSVPDQSSKKALIHFPFFPPSPHFPTH